MIHQMNHRLGPTYRHMPAEATRRSPTGGLGRLRPQPHRLRPNSARKVRTIRTAAAFSSGLYLRVVGFPGDCSFGMTPSSFPRSGAVRIFGAIQKPNQAASMGYALSPLRNCGMGNGSILTVLVLPTSRCATTGLAQAINPRNTPPSSRARLRLCRGGEGRPPPWPASLARWSRQ
jgi:hypothetical protein